MQDPTFPDSTLGILTGAAPSAERELGAAQHENEVVSLYEQFRNRLLRYLLSLGLSAHDGEEVIQETFLALFQHLQRGKSRENLQGWIFRVAHNLGLKQFDRNLRRSRRLVTGEDEVAKAHADLRPNPEQQLVNGERRKRLLAVLRALPEQDRWCLNLRLEGLRYREIARVLGMSLGAVSISLTRSLARLARADHR